ncbi:DUF1338 domain-containing protein [Vibrio mangrovi]|uniref:2-oxoadipate dioxygenase/decarboxylase n=1 Tax=Vibrio mangrovi TaxID=474394 RepID=A0A1Y6IX97_9VIBR|nr:DUF1338 domain-containing protein [Vibrio mangrovi]MDW6002766.1 DUF1338 domain-containing protein [Vibrio mangrovi]SMS02258.1 hypothetical protein VIM7927_03577 [Vibrio mangrovi]
MTPDSLFTALWQDYTTRLCPSAWRVHELLQENEPLINDHIALRTFNLPQVGLEIVAQPFLRLGYIAKGHYQFEQKMLRAQHFEHPNPKLPKVFISELEVNRCSEALQKIVRSLVSHVKPDMVTDVDFLYGGRLWPISLEQYYLLAEESEYAAWVAAHGYGANHFTVSVNQLSRFNQVAEVNAYLHQHGFVINAAGGEVKGSPELFLEQSSTMADRVVVEFDEAELLVPGGFYEFAKRYPMANGMLYPGFVEASADKIFESTHHQR